MLLKDYITHNKLTIRHAAIFLQVTDHVLRRYLNHGISLDMVDAHKIVTQTQGLVSIKDLINGLTLFEPIEHEEVQEYRCL